MPDSSIPSSESIETLVIGGGITGACFFHVAARRGRDVMLVEQSDFASGTSQASGMMVWGGLLYLRNLELRLVRKLSRARDHLLARRPDQVEVRRFEFLPLKRGGRPRWFVHAGLILYRALSAWCRGPIRSAASTAEERGWAPRRFHRGLTYEEGFLRTSDARFTLDWLRTSGRFDRALSHTVIQSLEWNPATRRFQVRLQDRTSGTIRTIEAANVVNCAGPWADSVNTAWGIETTTRHHPSKGVYLILPGDAHPQALAMEMEHEGDTLCWVPWGPVVLWGPTETDATGPDDLQATTEDVDFLLERLQRNSARKWTRDDILNVRVGVRPLALPPGREVGYSLDLSRRAVLEKQGDRPWWTAFGGKLSGALDFALEMHERIHGEQVRPDDLPLEPVVAPPLAKEFFGGLEVPEPTWCREREACSTLDDYLRRRTNIAQWIANGGIGRNQEHKDDLRRIAILLHGGDQAAAIADLDEYIERQTNLRRSWNHG